MRISDWSSDVCSSDRSDNEAMRIAEVCRYIEAHADTKLPLAALAQRAQLSPFHFQRRFKAIVGLSPKEYSEACRLKTLRRELRASPSVSDAIYGAGYGSGRSEEHTSELQSLIRNSYAVF